jgi:catechol 2,3-dioxygenase-like lactoylglutathione lyase family enzyme
MWRGVATPGRWKARPCSGRSAGALPDARKNIINMNHPFHLQRRPGVTAVHSIDRMVFTVPDLNVAQAFYTAFGLDARRVDEGRLDIYAFGHPHCWVTVHAAAGAKQLQYVCWGIDEDDLAIWRQRIAQFGIACAPHPMSEREGLWLRNPDGIAQQLVVASKVSPSSKSQHSPRAAVPAGHGAAPARSAVAQVRPRWLSHALFFTPDVKRMLDFHVQVLGLRLSDHSGEIIAFAHGPHGSDHHLIALAKSTHPGLHHTSWDVGSIDDVGCGAEQMRTAGHTQGWGMGRHVLGSNYFHYVRDPWGSYAEYSFDIDFVPYDLDWPAADHPAHDSLYVWGSALPQDFITNYEPQTGENT